MSHPDAAWLRALARYISKSTGSALNTLSHGGNATGAWQAGAVPHRGPGGTRTVAGLNAAGMLADPGRCFLLWGIEPELDMDNPSRAMKSLEEAGKVISVASWADDGLREVSDVILPLAALAESEGSVVNLDGETMNFKAAGKAPGEARPGWKILRRLGSELGLQGFEQVSMEQLQSDLAASLDGEKTEPVEANLQEPGSADGLFRIGELPIYSVDALCRRSEPLQQTIQAESAFLGLNPSDADRLGLVEGGKARVTQGAQQAEFEVRISERVPAGGAWLRSASCATRMLEHSVAPMTVEVA